jgi:carboxymethylenebutenolidase
MTRLDHSPRHGEWVTIRTDAQTGDSLRAWVVYPQRSTKAPVVVVVHEIFGLSTWVRSVADQLAAEGFIAIAPDFLTGKIALCPTDTISMQQGMALVRTLDPAVVQRQIDAAANYGMSLPAATQRYGVVGFCWGGGVSFAHAVHSPTVGAAVVYYGTSPSTAELANVRAPVLGLYGGNDERVDATIPPADSAMKAMGKSFTYQIFPGAGHGFLRAQDQMNGANRAAAVRAWPMTVQFFRTNLER